MFVQLYDNSATKFGDTPAAKVIVSIVYYEYDLT
jgi:hypothetical protein